MNKIISFLEKNHIFTLATSFNDAPYCAPLFYVFDKERMALIFASNPDTRHIAQALANPFASGAIYTQTLEVAKIQGLQFTGVVKEALKGQKAIYLKRFPYAAAMDTSFWQMELGWIKMTDNTLGFKTKLIWSR